VSVSCITNRGVGATRVPASALILADPAAQSRPGPTDAREDDDTTEHTYLTREEGRRSARYLKPEQREAVRRQFSLKPAFRHDGRIRQRGSRSALQLRRRRSRRRQNPLLQNQSGKVRTRRYHHGAERRGGLEGRAGHFGTKAVSKAEELYLGESLGQHADAWRNLGGSQRGR
jgi:hypothetical protein